MRYFPARVEPSMSAPGGGAEDTERQPTKEMPVPKSSDRARSARASSDTLEVCFSLYERRTETGKTSHSGGDQRYGEVLEAFAALEVAAITGEVYSEDVARCRELPHRRDALSNGAHSLNRQVGIVARIAGRKPPHQALKGGGLRAAAPHARAPCSFIVERGARLCACEVRIPMRRGLRFRAIPLPESRASGPWPALRHVLFPCIHQSKQS